MARPTRAQAEARIGSSGLADFPIRELAALLASGKWFDNTDAPLAVANPDGSAIGSAGGGGAVVAAAPVIVAPGQYALAVPSAGAALTLTIPGTATHALVSVDLGAGDVRYTLDGTTPSATNGHLLQAGDTFEFDNIASLKLYATAVGTTIQVSYRHY